jgi:hypothetical protein
VVIDWRETCRHLLAINPKWTALGQESLSKYANCFECAKSTDAVSEHGVCYVRWPLLVHIPARAALSADKVTCLLTEGHIVRWVWVNPAVPHFCIGSSGFLNRFVFEAFVNRNGLTSCQNKFSQNWVVSSLALFLRWWNYLNCAVASDLRFMNYELRKEIAASEVTKRKFALVNKETGRSQSLRGVKA